MFFILSAFSCLAMRLQVHWGQSSWACYFVECLGYSNALVHDYYKSESMHHLAIRADKQIHIKQ